MTYQRHLGTLAFVLYSLLALLASLLPSQALSGNPDELSHLVSHATATQNDRITMLPGLRTELLHAQTQYLTSLPATFPRPGADKPIHPVWYLTRPTLVQQVSSLQNRIHPVWYLTRPTLVQQVSSLQNRIDTLEFSARSALVQQVSSLQNRIDTLEFSARSALGSLAAAVAPPGIDPVVLANSWLDLPVERFAVISSALSLLATPYRFGGTTPLALDCSGFTSLVYRQALGQPLRLKAAYQFEDLVSVPVDALQPGDLLFYAGGSTAAGPLDIGHVAMYLGATLLVHASSRHGLVLVESTSDLRPPVAAARVITPG